MKPRTGVQGTLIASGGYNFSEANSAIAEKQFDLIAIGRPFLANPNLVNQLKSNEDIIPYHESMLMELN